jgi:peroxiredoxin
VALLSATPLRAALLLVLALASPARAGVDAGDAAPDFTLTSLDGKSDSLSAHRGRIVLLDFWASWCTPCIPELQCLSKLREASGKEKIDLVAVSIDRDEETARAFASSRLAGIDASLLHDPEGELPSRYGAEGLPAFYLIDETGQVRVAHGGAGGCEAAKRHLATREPADRPALEGAPANP